MARARGGQATKRGRTDRGALATDSVALLVARATDGDQSAWDALVAKFGPEVWATTRAYRLSAADAADVFQTSWMRLVESLDRIQDPARVGAWLATTARHECLHVIRCAARLIPSSDELPDPTNAAPQPIERLISQQNAAAVDAALKRLRPRDSSLLRMLAAEPAPSYKEIGAALGMPVGSIGPTRERALTRLRREAGRSGLTAQDRAAA
jgi:RNA polymerase sigma factor (sigma-70 family)